MDKFYVLNVHDYSMPEPSSDSIAMQVEKDVTCKRCDKTFFNASSLKRHVLRIHEQKAKYSGGIRCTECKQKMISRDVLNEHLHIKHNVEINVENHNFKDFKEFQTWKQNMETETQSSYVMTRSNVCKGKKMIIYSCHRSGFHHRLGDKRNLKKNGSNKINGTCPAYIQTIYSMNGEDVNIRYVSTHHGHINEVDRLRLTQQEKMVLACKLEQGIPQVELLTAVQENFNPSKRMSYTTKKDLHNIRASFNQKSKINLDADDAAKVDVLIESCLSMPDSPILAYKPIGIENADFPTLNENEFFLVFMNDVQIEIFKSFGYSVVIFDSNRVTNLYGIQLVTMMVIDEDCDGLPFAFLYNTSATVNVYVEFFKLLHKRLPSLHLNCFMSDGSSASYEAWTKVFGSPAHKLLSSWHVKRNWNHHLNSKIFKQEKRSLVHKQLCSLLEELDKKYFSQLLDQYSKQWAADDGIKKFGIYFDSQYGTNFTEWARCYRTHLLIVADGCIELWHRLLETDNDKEEICDQRLLEGAIVRLFHCLNRMFLINNVSVIGAKLIEKIDQLRTSHQNSLFIDADIQTVEAEKKWNVMSKKTAQTFVVEVVSEVVSCGHCQLVCESCGVCVHCMSCSCMENQTKFYMCEHIHLICKQTGFGKPTDDVLIASAEIAETESVNLDQSTLAEVIQTVVVEERLEEMRSSAYLKALKLLEAVQNCTTSESLDFIRRNISLMLSKVDSLEKAHENMSSAMVIVYQ